MSCITVCTPLCFFSSRYDFDTTGTMIGVAEQAGLIKTISCRMPEERFWLIRPLRRWEASSAPARRPRSWNLQQVWRRKNGADGADDCRYVCRFHVFSPLVSVLSEVSAITSPALIIVGSLMMGAVSNIRWNELDEAFPTLVILAMPLTSSISTGIALGFISYPLVKAAKKNGAKSIL